MKMIKFSSKRLENESTQRGTETIDPNQFCKTSQKCVFKYFKRVTGLDLTKPDTPEVRFNSLPESCYSSSLWSDFAKMPNAVLYNRKYYWLTNHVTSCRTLLNILAFKRFNTKRDALAWYNNAVADAKSKPYTTVVDYVSLV